MRGAASEEEMLNIRLSVFVQKINRERKLPHVLQISITHMYVLVLNLVFSQAIEFLVMYLTPLFSRLLFVFILLHSKC